MDAFERSIGTELATAGQMEQMDTKQDNLLQKLASDPLLRDFTFEVIDLVGFNAVVARSIPHEQAVAMWRAACRYRTESRWPILTDDELVHSYYEEIIRQPQLSLELVRAARKRVVRSSQSLNAVFERINTAIPSSEAYDERDAFLEEPSGPISLVLVDAPMAEAVEPFTGDGEGTMPTHNQLAAMLRHFNQQYGAEPIYADGYFLELDVPRPPQHLEDLRAAARDMFLTSQGTHEGYGVEDPARLLRRLMSTRWVLWWYGIY